MRDANAGNNGDCPFCRILSTESESFLFEDDLCIVLLSRIQKSRGHIIVLPKRHAESPDELSEDEYLHLHEIVKKYYAKVMKAFEPEKIYILSFGEEVNHFHFHLIPRYAGDAKGPKFLTEDTVDVADSDSVFSEIMSA